MCVTGIYVMKINILIFLICFFLSLNSNASTSKWSAGLGTQYALAGVKYTIYNDINNFYISGGLGIVLGTEIPLPVNNKLTIDANIGAG